MINPIAFVGIGEVLYDVFEDGTETLGGAPLNFAVHAHQWATLFGIGDGTIVSCINSDRRGYKIQVIPIDKPLDIAINCEASPIEQLTDGTYRIMPKAVPNSKESLALSAVGSSFATLSRFHSKSDRQRWNLKTP